MTSILDVTQSELSTFRTCRKKWDFRYREALIPLRHERALTVGSHFHHAVRVLYNAIRTGVQHGDEMRSIVEAELIAREAELTRSLVGLFVDGGDSDPIGELEMVGREARAAARMFVAAFGEVDARECDVVAVEREFAVPLGDGRSHGVLRGAIDLILRERSTGRLILDEHKSTVGPANELDARLDVDGQVRAYLYAMRMLYPGEEVGTVRLNAVRKRAPSAPKINKDGSVSAAACDTTRGIYKAALVQQVKMGKPITEAQGELLQRLPDSTARWVSRHEVFITPKLVDEWVHEARADLRLLRASSGKTKRALPVTRNPASCTLPWARPCAYRSICVDDTPERRATEYRVGQRYEELAKEGEQETTANEQEW